MSKKKPTTYQEYRNDMAHWMLSVKEKPTTHQEYLDAMNHWMLSLERDRLETRVKRLLTARNKWRKRARVAEAKVADIADVQTEIERAQTEIADTQMEIKNARALTEIVKASKR